MSEGKRPTGDRGITDAESTGTGTPGTPEPHRTPEARETSEAREAREMREARASSGSVTAGSGTGTGAVPAARPESNRRTTGTTNTTSTTAPAGATETDTTAGAARTTGTSTNTGTSRAGSTTALFPHDESDKLTLRLQQAVTGFVDAPRGSVEEADHVLEEIAARFTEAVTKRRQSLRTSWQSAEHGAGHSTDRDRTTTSASGTDTAADTEQLRLALRDYRELAERLLRV
ncbi:hypothetical protein ACWCQK_16655 [Streptomyces sp. NPDC002306]